MSLYYCSSCADTIPLHKPRINCIDCRFHSICANCYVLSMYTGQHVQGHTTKLIPKSGRILPPPLPTRHSSTAIPQSLPHGRPEVGRRPVGAPQVQQQIPQYAPQPVPSSYGQSGANPTRMSYIPAQPTPPTADSYGNLGGSSNRISQQYILTPQQGPPPVVNSGANRNQGGSQPMSQYIQPLNHATGISIDARWNAPPSSQQLPQYIQPPPQSTSPNTLGNPTGNSQQIFHYSTQPTPQLQQVTPISAGAPGLPQENSQNVSYTPQSAAPLQEKPPVSTEQAYNEPQENKPLVANIDGSETPSRISQKNIPPLSQYNPPLIKKELSQNLPLHVTPPVTAASPVHSLPQQPTPPVTNTTPVYTEAKQATPFVATTEPHHSTQCQEQPPVARADLVNEANQVPFKPTGTPVFNLPPNSPLPVAREGPLYNMAQQEPPRAPNAVYTQLPVVTPTSSWNPIFDGCEPSATGAAFLNTVFDCLDIEKKGLLTPEQYSAFNDFLGYELHEDVWKRSNVPQFGHNGEDLADYEFRTVLKNFSFDHVLRPRITVPNNDMSNLLNGIPGISSSFANLMTQNQSPSLLTPPASGGMPLLTRKGFVDITTLEMLGDPEVAWQRFNKIARHYNIWREWGDCPREMFPLETPQKVTERIARVTAVGKRQSEQLIDAARVQASLQQQGRDAALRLLDPPGTRYYYSY